MNQPLISVIIPAHNNAKTIGTAIESILEQTYPNLEIIVVDDNSTDGTEVVVNGYAKTHGNISYHKLPFDDPKRFNKRGRNVNAGYAARNYGLEKTRGEWITFQDGDDASLKNRISAQYDLAIRLGVMHIATGWQQLTPERLGKSFDVNTALKNETGIVMEAPEIKRLARRTKGIMMRVLGPLHKFIPFEWKTARAVNKLFFGSLDSYPASGNSPLFRKEIIEKVRFRPVDERVWPSFTGRGADRDFNFQVAETFGQSCTVKVPLYLWRVWRENDLGYDFSKYLVE